MERLTIRNRDGTVSQPTNTTVEQVFYRLAAYEDTGVAPGELYEIQNEAYDLGYQSCLNYKGMKWTEAEELQRYRETGMTPEQLQSNEDIDFVRIIELLRADSEGRLVVLPAKTVWELTVDAGPDCDLKCPVDVWDEALGCELCSKGKQFAYERPCTQERLKKLGKTVFLTCEEAEAAIVKEADDD